MEAFAMKNLGLAFALGLISQASWAGTAQIDLAQIVKRNPQTEAYCESDPSIPYCGMSFKKAEEYCASQNATLPSVRDFISYAVTRGAKGMVPDFASGSRNFTRTLNIRDSNDNFVEEILYDISGYRDPLGVQNRISLWTKDFSMTEVAYFYSANHGEFGAFTLPGQFAVICLPL